MDRGVEFLLLQINDALFPIGAYSHSYGLETYIQKEIVTDSNSAFKYIENNLKYNFLYNDLLSLKLAYERAKEGDIRGLLDLEEIVIASKVPMEIRNASLKLGSRFIKTLSSIDIKLESNIFKEYVEKCKENSISPCYSIAYGVFTYSVGIKFNEAIRNYIYCQTSSMVTNCVKLIPLSQTNGQKLLYKCYDIFNKIMEELDTLSINELGISTPAFNIRAMEHEDLYSRLYMS